MKVLKLINDNRMLTAGIITLIFVIFFGVVGSWFVDRERADVGAGRPAQPPSLDHWLGTDQQGRDVFADIVYGTPGTLKIGLIAAIVGVGVGTILGFISGYFGGYIDSLIRFISDVFMTIPVLMILIILASLLDVMSNTMLGLLIAAFGWMGALRVTRAQVLTMRERAYIQVAKLNGVNDLEIIFKEMIPNLLPFIAASLVGASAGAVLASLGLSALGLGPQNEPSIGLTIFWVLHYGALIRELWWWFMPPIIVMVLLFVSLFMITAGLDRIANPRLRTTV
ncbi:MAG: maltose ABC transporter permease [Chloroflexi bacterium]|nr:maltose ABC transporter permease [Chloroflexota bacterium]|tara:strand:- start:1451 stop:2293 length:843 start_codon:yes stop_codon:yes gene_type:complete